VQTILALLKLWTAHTGWQPTYHMHEKCEASIDVLQFQRSWLPSVKRLEDHSLLLNIEGLGFRSGSQPLSGVEIGALASERIA
jgi:hypothetical protein